MFQKTDRKLKTITPSDAAKLLNCNTFEWQRPIRESHVNMLADEMRKGAFLTGDIGLACFEKMQILVNGQHTLKAVLRTRINIEAVVSCYQCENKDDISNLFKRYDNNLLRSLRDVSVVEAGALGYEWKERLVQLVVTAASMKTGLYHKASTKNRKAELLKEFKSHGDFLAEIMEPWNKSKHLRKGAIVHAIFETFEKNSEDAFIFWENVKMGERLACSDPEFLLREFLIASCVSTGRASDREIFSRCITAWNNFRKNTKLKILKYSQSYTIPKPI